MKILDSIQLFNQRALDTIQKSAPSTCVAGLVQRGKGRYEFLREGAALAGRTRRRTFEAGGDQPMEYEKDMRNRPAVLDSLTCALSALLNLSVLKSNQASPQFLNLIRQALSLQV